MSATERLVRVRHTIVAEYTVPADAYEGMTDEEIRAWESDSDNIDPGTILDNIVSELHSVWFTDGAKA